MAIDDFETAGALFANRLLPVRLGRGYRLEGKVEVLPANEGPEDTTDFDEVSTWGFGS